MEKISFSFTRLQCALEANGIYSIYLKPKQVQCFDFLLDKNNVMAVLPTGFRKSLLFHLLPHFIPVVDQRNIVIVVCPLNSIIEDSRKSLLTGELTLVC